MPADRKQVEEAVERLRWWLRNFPGYAWLVDYKGDIEDLLTDHAAVLARAEAAEAALRRYREPGGWRDLADADARRVLGDPAKSVRVKVGQDPLLWVNPAPNAAPPCAPTGAHRRVATHQPPAPVKAGGD